MATRMQQRRGTAAQWTSSNAGDGPILNAGEIGWESDTNKFKIGDGVSYWSGLTYFVDATDVIASSLGAYLQDSDVGAASGVVGLDASKNAIVTGSSIIIEGATDNTYETTLTVTDPTADRTITFPNATGTVVLSDGSGNVTVSGDLTVSGTTTTINSTTINATTGIIFEGATADAFETTLTVTDPTADRTVTFQDATGTVVLRDSTDTLTNKSISLGSNTVTSTLAQLNTAVSDADVASLAGSETLTNKTVSLGSNTVSGTLAQFNTAVTDADFASLAGTETLTNKTLTTPVISSITNGAATLTLPTSTGTVALTTDITASTLANDSITAVKLAGDSVTSSKIQNGAVETAKLADSAVTSAKIANDTIVNADINSAAAIALSKLATDPLARANHTGSQTASTISDFNEAAQDAIGGILGTGLTYNDASNTITVDSTNIQLRVTGVTDTEIGYLDGVTSAIQTQMDAKLASATASTTYAPLASPALTGTATAVNLTVSGDLTVNGTTTNINSTSLVVEDKNVVLGDVATPSDVTADGGGITLKGATDKTFNWVDATDAWTSSEHINLASGKTLKYNGTDLVAAQSGNSGKYLTTDGTTTSWGTVAGYSAPTLGSTSIASGATVTTIAGLTKITAATVAKLDASGYEQDFDLLTIMGAI